MRGFNTNDMRDNRPGLIVGSRWYARINRRFVVRITKIENGYIHIEAPFVKGRPKSHMNRVVREYGFLQVYKPVEKRQQGQGG